MPTPLPPPGPSAGAPIAPRWHTAALIALIVAVALTGTLLVKGSPTSAPAAPGSRLIATYFPLLMVQWGLAFYVSRVGRPRSALLALLGQRWASVGRACVDVALALAGYVFIKAAELAWVSFSGHGAAASVVTMLPHTSLERLVWALVAVSVGFCEELVYRGYLQTQLAAFTGRASVAIVLQALLFGIAHAEQGAGAVVRLSLYGLAFGALARWRRSLVPGIVCHAGTDLASGLLAP